MNGIDAERESPQQMSQMLAEVGADVLLVGHTHQPFQVDAAGGGVVANPGALLRDPGEPPPALATTNEPTRGDAAGGTFGVLELPSKRFTIRRVRDGAEVAREG